MENRNKIGTDQKVIICSLYKKENEYEASVSLDELERLVETADCVTAARLTQCLETVNARTVMGKGKIDELSDLCEKLGASLVVFDLEMTPSQIRNVEDSVKVSVIDRSMLILDIFAKHAKTQEGKIQVELAQLKYTAPRLRGKGTELSRQGGTAASGSVGARGPGETKLEIDRRRVNERINALEKQLKKIEKNRLTMRSQRDKSGTLKCGIIGYTNAGKSTLLNYLTDENILAEDKLFATLDPTTRQFITPSGVKVLMTDTVGFIRNLPHHLINAFRSTFEEAVHSDVLLIVIDASDENFDSQIEVTTELLKELGAYDKKIVYVFNKCDICTDEDRLVQMKAAAKNGNGYFVFISAKTGSGCDTLVSVIEQLALSAKRRVSLFIPPEDGSVTGIIYKYADDVDMEYCSDGIRCDCIVDGRLYSKIEKYIVDPGTVREEEEDD